MPHQGTRLGCAKEAQRRGRGDEATREHGQGGIAEAEDKQIKSLKVCVLTESLKGALRVHPSSPTGRPRRCSGWQASRMANMCLR